MEVLETATPKAGKKTPNRWLAGIALPALMNCSLQK